MTTMTGHRVLCVDLDGTLIAGDTLWECCIRLLKQRPWLAFLLPFWLLAGRSVLKARLGRIVSLGAEGLPYRRNVLEYLRQQKESGRLLWLVTAADESIAKAVAEHLALFDGVMASCPQTNLKGRNKLAAMVERFGSDGFDYLGDSLADIPIWRHTKRPIAVASKGFAVKIERAVGVKPETFERLNATLRDFIKAIRVHQWAKNFLIFIPLAMSHRVTEIPLVIASLTAFFSFSLMASAVYVVNDLLDLEADRQHVRKRMRPFAQGVLSIPLGIVLALGLTIGSLSLAMGLSVGFVGLLLVYWLVTTFYSFYLKKRMIVDVLTLAGLYTHRLLAGGQATGIELSPWLLVFSMFLFLSLALLKRHSELQANLAKSKPLAGRGYHPGDIEMIRLFGAASGLLAVMVMAQYIHSDMSRRLYAHPHWLWLECPLMLYWIMRLWLMGHRGQVHEDPVLFAIKDRRSWIVGLLAVILVILAAWPA